MAESAQGSRTSTRKEAAKDCAVECAEIVTREIESKLPEGKLKRVCGFIAELANRIPEIRQLWSGNLNLRSIASHIQDYGRKY